MNKGDETIDNKSNAVMDSGSWQVNKHLKSRLGLPIVDLNAEQSRFFKYHYSKQYRNTDIMVRE